MKNITVKKEPLKLTICQTDQEWQAFQFELKQKQVIQPETRVIITASGTGVSGFDSQKADTEDVKPIPFDF